MTPIDLVFTLNGQSLPCDHGFPLYSAISRLLPAVHESNGIAIHPVRGQCVGEQRMLLTDSSRLVIRTATDRIADLLPLAGKQLAVGGHPPLRVGVPQVHALTPSTALRSRLTIIKISSDTPTAPTSDAFAAALRRKLDAFGVAPECRLTLGRRRTMRIHGKTIVGYEVLLEHLTAEESLNLQANTPPDPAQRFGRNHMGCGVFCSVLPRGGRQ